jgi:hypothetical protein
MQCVSMTHHSSEQTPQHEPPRSADEILLESSLESFPASDPPAWVYGKDLPPQETLSLRSEPHKRAKKTSWFKRAVLWWLQRDTPPEPPAGIHPQ